MTMGYTPKNFDSKSFNKRQEEYEKRISRTADRNYIKEILREHKKR